MQLGSSLTDISGKMIGKKKLAVKRSVGKKAPTVAIVPAGEEANCKSSKPGSSLPDISGKMIGKKKLAVKRSVGKKPSTVAIIPLGQQANCKSSKLGSNLPDMSLTHLFHHFCSTGTANELCNCRTELRPEVMQSMASFVVH